MVGCAVVVSFFGRCWADDEFVVLCLVCDDDGVDCSFHEMLYVMFSKYGNFNV
jgi:hypothetical protein